MQWESAVGKQGNAFRKTGLYAENGFASVRSDLHRKRRFNSAVMALFRSQREI